MKVVKQQRGVASKEAQLLEMVEPQFITLVDSPANRCAFKIVRSEKDGTKLQAAENVQRADGLISIELPGIEDEAVVRELMGKFSLSDEYSANKVDGGYIVVRNDVEGVPADARRIPITDEAVAVVAVNRSETQDPKGHIAVTDIEFDYAKGWDEAKTHQWTVDKGITVERAEQTSTGMLYVFGKGAMPYENVKPIVLEDGCRASICLRAEQSIPEGIYSGVVEKAYGDYGWGQLDFNAYMADRIFTDAGWDAIYGLRNILEEIMYYSYLDIDARIALVERATAQFTEYVVGLMQALPREMLASRREIVKETDMSKDAAPEKGNAKDVQPESTETIVERNEGEAVPAVEEATTEVTTEEPAVDNNEETAVVSREAEDNAGQEEAAPPATEGDNLAEIVRSQTENLGKVLSALDKLTETQAKRDEAQNELSEKVDALIKRVDGLETTAVVRSTPEKAAPVEESNQPVSVFRGVLGIHS